MQKQYRRVAVLGALMLTIGACGGSSSDGSGDEAEEAATTTEAAETTTTAEETTTTTEATTTTEEPTTTTEATTTAAMPDAPPAGTGTLTVAGVDYPFTIDTCTTEPTIIGSSTLSFDMRGSSTIEDRTVEVRAFRSETPEQNDSYGYGYTDDVDDFNAAVSVGPESGIGLAIEFAEVDGGLLFWAGERQFVRTQGFSVDDEVDPGMGSIVGTCQL